MDLFGYNKSDKEVTLENAQHIAGLKILFDFISKEEEKELLNNIDKSAWLTVLKRRVQHYGYKYDYKARRIDKSFFIGEIPNWMKFLSDRLQQQKIIDDLDKSDSTLIKSWDNRIDTKKLFDTSVNAKFEINVFTEYLSTL